ncbi:MAG: hypothetical protein ACU841_08610 [Gammaproteobacteria bacterium]
MTAPDTGSEASASRCHTGPEQMSPEIPRREHSAIGAQIEMNPARYPVSPYPVDLSRKDLRRMVGLVRLLHRLSGNRDYRNHLECRLPRSARFDPGHHSVMMAYDFHLAPSGPKLIEVNTNAGGIWYVGMCYGSGAAGFPEPLSRKLLKSFIDDYALYRREPMARPKSIVIVDEHPLEQPLYPEMRVFETLFRQAGIETTIADPEAILADTRGLTIDGRRIDMIYNRHCDFYLNTAALQTIRKAWLNAQVCLSPNPHSYGLLADKRRMVLWSDSELMQGFGLNRRELSVLAEMIPETRLLNSLTPEDVWRTRKRWVFKPDTGYASRGVYVGEKLTRHKLAELDPDNTLIQQRIPPSVTRADDGRSFKTDIRLFTYQDRTLALSARMYQGQVTNLRTEGGGFARVRLVD